MFAHLAVYWYIQYQENYDHSRKYAVKAYQKFTAYRNAMAGLD